MISLSDAPVHDQLCQLSFQIMGLISKRQINVNPQLTFDKHVLMQFLELHPIKSIF